MKTLHKTIKKKWFDMIVSGVKKHEYLEIKPYWERRLLDLVDNDNPDFRESYEIKRFDTVTCRNGYNKSSPLVVWEHLETTIGEGKAEWGAEPGKKYFILHIGKIISLT